MKRLAAISLLGTTLWLRAEWVLPEGYQVQEFAREPRIVDPVAMDWDAAGNVWVLESSGRIKILGKETRVFAEGFAGATGLAVRGNAALVARPPELWLVQSTNRQLLLTNLPPVNSLHFRPDGWLYFATS